MFNWSPTLIAKCFSIPASSLPLTTSVLEDFASGMFLCLQVGTHLVIFSSNAPSLSRLLCVIFMSWFTFQFLPSQGYVWEPFACSSHFLQIINKGTKSQHFRHQQWWVFLRYDSSVLPNAFSLPYTSFAFQFRLSFLLGQWCCPLHLYFILFIIFFLRGFSGFWTVMFSGSIYSCILVT